MMVILLLVIGGVIIVGGSILALVLLRPKGKQPGNKKTLTLATDLQNEQIKSEIILNSIDDGVVYIDSAGRIKLFNPAAAKISGWNQQDAISLDHHAVLDFVDEKGVAYTTGQNPFDRAFTGGANTRDNTTSLKTHASGHIVAVDISVSLLLSQHNTILGAVGVFRDVSQERSAEKQRAEFISTASHEMRTPVAAIEGYLALALNEKVARVDTKAREYLEKAHASTQHLGKLFQDLLTAAKSEDGRLSNHPSVVEMGQYLQEIVDGMKFTAEKKGLILEYMIGAPNDAVDASGGQQKVVRPLYYTHVDPDRMREVVTNLFDNAIKYTEQGKITIGITGDNNVVQMRVSDTGGGIPQEDIPHLFQKFYRVDNSATRTIGGTGLGLFICRKIVELYSGRIWVDSQINKGSTFYINLPRLTSDRANRLLAEEAANVSSADNSNPAASATI